ncbi:ATP-dependent RNA helicase [Verticillium nonalfalfae]|uniref:ATP-dependent RNA helicase n=1 Tax=Verticillium nonalfalfae TaxID=1051616 RepID=A0A3M9Y485_9PEZI|nr:ATP-dependent RNA helicase [Verticillium nonalfalfae]RNJ55104.1 ATP-dependent RNA helicase [Verticillium nonalfalfae]
MAPIQKNKRKAAPKTGPVDAPPKRQKLAVPKTLALPKKRKAVAAEKLPWKKINVPEMFDDAEGFYALEAIEGVDVVRNGDKIEFHAVEEDLQKQTEDAAKANKDDDEFQGFSDAEAPADTKPAVDTKPAKLTKGAKKVAGLTDATNMTDVDPREEAAKAAENGDTADEKPKNKKDKRREKQEKKKEKLEQKIKAQPVKKDAALESNVFSTLEEAEDDTEDLDMSEWMGLNLSPATIATIRRLKFTKPTTIQSAAIPHIQAGHDVIGKASTGSGKTLAFGIPIVDKWLEKNGEEQDSAMETDDAPEAKAPLALIISPTRELAHQIMNHIKELCAGLSKQPYVCSVTGGLSVYKQQRQLAKADIVVGTPGRLWEVLSTNTAVMESFKKIQYLVVDEADRILSEGHFKEAEEIFKALDRNVTEEDDEDEQTLSPRQTLVFSATFHKGLQQKLAGKGKFGLMSEEESMEYLLKRLNFREEKPEFVDVNPVSQMAEGLKEGMIECGAMEKDLYLYALILLNPNRRSLVFTNSISTVRRLTPMLANLNLNALPLHSQMPQKARLRSVERFTSTKPGTASILIATDVAARGLDIPGIDQVIHYHVPRAADMYVHRSGRTARAATSGLSILLCAPEEVTPTRRLAAKVHHEQAGKNKYLIRTVDIDRKLASRLKPRVDLAKKLADAVLAKEKGGKDDDWVKKAADELGVEYDSEELEKSGQWGGRGSQRKKKQEAARGVSKAEMGVMRAQLRELLSKRVNAGVSERYITGGKIDVEELLRGAKGDFLGHVDGLDI